MVNKYMPGMIVMHGKTETIYIRCTPELKEKMRRLFTISGEKSYADFLDKLLELYKIMMDRTRNEKIGSIIESLQYDGIVV